VIGVKHHKEQIIKLKLIAMMDFILVPLVVGIVTLGIYKLFELFVHRKERLIMIEKMGLTFDASLLQNKFNFNETNRPVFSTLKVACLMLGVGLGLLIGFILSQYFGLNVLEGNNYHMRELAGVIYGSSVLFVGGIGLLVAFILEMKFSKKSRE